jgi:hypothetical protein
MRQLLELGMILHQTLAKQNLVLVLIKLWHQVAELVPVPNPTSSLNRLQPCHRGSLEIEGGEARLHQCLHDVYLKIQFTLVTPPTGVNSILGNRDDEFRNHLPHPYLDPDGER